MLHLFINKPSFAVVQIDLLSLLKLDDLLDHICFQLRS